MRSTMLWLVVFGVFTLGCAEQRSPTVRPEEPPAEADEASTAERAASSVEATVEPCARAESIDDPGDPEAQCLAGGAQACRTLCDAEASICDKTSAQYKKDKCKEASKAVPLCPSAPGDVTLGRLCRLPPSALSPTQGAVGGLAVACKSRSLEEKADDSGWKFRRYLMARPVPVVLGPDARRYLTDRHHLSTGLERSTVDPDEKLLYLCPMANRAESANATFWTYMENNNFAWLHDREGHEITPDQLPPDLASLADDPFRTLSRWVRDSCGYIKCGKVCGGDGDDTRKLARCKQCSVAPYFLEFHWADYMRDRREECGISNAVYGRSTEEQAQVLPDKLGCLMELVRRPAALELGLPGWNHGLIETKNVALDGNGCEE